MPKRSRLARTIKTVHFSVEDAELIARLSRQNHMSKSTHINTGILHLSNTLVSQGIISPYEEVYEDAEPELGYPKPRPYVFVEDDEGWFAAEELQDLE